jgi:hypothetical protein
MIPTIPTKKDIINPPGTQLNTEITVTPIGYLDLGATFEQPLPTLPQAIRNDNNSSITVSVIVLVNTTLELLTFKINQLFTISNNGERQLQFFIYCDEEQLISIGENLSTNNTYKSFKVNFTTNNTTGFPIGPEKVVYPERYISSKIEIKDINLVETFLWDIDPKTSRGTVTSVGSAV